MKELKLFFFGNQIPQFYQTNKVEIGTRSLGSEIMTIDACILD